MGGKFTMVTYDRPGVENESCDDDTHALWGYNDVHMKTILFPSLTIEGAASGCLNNERVITVSSRTLN